MTVTLTLTAADDAISSLALADPVVIAPSSGWNPIKIGGGGYMTGMAIHPDGTMVARVDVFGAYVGSTTPGTVWRQVVTAAGMPLAYSNNHPYAAGGVVEIAVAPSNSSVLYMLWGMSGRSLSTALKSLDKGMTWQVTGFPLTADDPNDEVRYQHGQLIAIDPHDPNTVYVGTRSNGLYVTHDGGVTFAAVSGVPASSTTGVCAILIDPASGTNAAGHTNRIIVGSNGHGIYATANGGGTWVQITSTFNDPGHGKLHVDGTAYFTNMTQDHVWRITPANVVTDISGTAGPSNNGAATIACDPTSADRLVCVDTGGAIAVCTNCRSAAPTWSAFNLNFTIMAADCPWLAASQDRFLSQGDAFFDPSVANRVWVAMGTAVLYADDVPNVAASGAAYKWNSQTAGIENLVANQIIVPPGGKPVLACWDRPFWHIDNPDVYAAGYGPYYTTGDVNPVMGGAGLSYSTADPTFVCGFTWLSPDYTWGISHDGGKTWQQWPHALPLAGVGGSITSADANRIVIAESNNATIHATQNGGTTWAHPAALPTSGYGSFYANDAQHVCADQVTAGTFYVYCNGSAPGVHRSTDGGLTWTQRFSGHLDADDTYQLRLQSVPGNAGHLYYTSGDTSDHVDFTSLATLAASVPSGQQFFKSIDGGLTFTPVPNVLDVICFGFGMPKPGGGGYPTVLICGWVNGVYGVWRSDDAQNATPTWTQIGTFPRGWLDQPKCIAGDPGAYNKCYTGYIGSGFAYYVGPANGSATPTP